jgi:hypothetical protein
MALPSLVDVSIPDSSHITVCGDVHGQYYDMMHIFKLNGNPSPENPYLFNGAPGLLRGAVPRRVGSAPACAELAPSLFTPPAPEATRWPQRLCACRRFCGPRLIQRGGYPHAAGLEGAVPPGHAPVPGQP